MKREMQKPIWGWLVTLVLVITLVPYIGVERVEAGTGISSNRAPIGFVDNLLSLGSERITVSGFAYDPDSPSTSIDIDIYVGGEAGNTTAECHRIKADQDSSYYNEQYGITGNHRFISTIQVNKTGTQNVYIYALDTTHGNNPRIGSGSVQIKEKPVVKVSSVKVTPNNITLDIGESYELMASVAPSNATNKTVTWKSSNTAVVKVTSAGKITAISNGTAQITATAGGRIGVSNVTVKDPNEVTSVVINHSDFAMKIGEQKTLLATVSPTNATNKTVTWKSSNTSVAAITSSGRLTAKAAGTTTITATAGGVSSSIEVTVKSDVVLVETMSLEYGREDPPHWFCRYSSKVNELVLKISTGAFINVNISPSNATNKEIEFEGTGTDMDSITILDVDHLLNNTGDHAIFVMGWETGDYKLKIETCDGSNIRKNVNIRIVKENGWYTDGKGRKMHYSEASDGHLVNDTGWKKINNKYYYFDSDGHLVKDAVDNNHKWDNGKVKKAATCTKSGVRLYTCKKCGATKTVTIKASGHKKVKDKAVKPTTSKTGLTKGSHCSVCGKTIVKQKVVAKLKSGWKKKNGKSYYYINGVKKTGWLKLGKKKYYFDKKGVMQTGWKKIGEKKYYFGTDGIMQTGWKCISGIWYYFDNNGIWISTAKRKTVTDRNGSGGNNNGSKQYGWKTINGKKYYFNSNGVKVTGWKTIKNKRYFFDINGVMVLEMAA